VEATAASVEILVSNDACSQIVGGSRAHKDDVLKAEAINRTLRWLRT
jgi:hypothetical protein